MTVIPMTKVAPMKVETLMREMKMETAKTTLVERIIQTTKRKRGHIFWWVYK